MHQSNIIVVGLMFVSAAFYLPALLLAANGRLAITRTSKREKARPGFWLGGVLLASALFLYAIAKKYAG